jgi:RNA polymerase sigma factor (sigma-70 family)
MKQSKLREIQSTHVSAVPDEGDLFRRLLDHESAFRSFLRRRIDNDAVAEDLLQQSFVRAVQHQHSLRNDHSVVAWFYRVLRNTIIDYYRSQSAEGRRNEAFLHEAIHLGEDTAPPVDEVTTVACQCLYSIIPHLKETYSDLLQRIDLEGQATAQVAKDLNVTSNNLTVRLHRARQALRSGLERSCGICSKHGCFNCSC